MDIENCKYAAPNAYVVPNATPFIDFGLNMLATGRVEPTIRIYVVTQPLNFTVFDRVFCQLLYGTQNPKSI